MRQEKTLVNFTIASNFRRGKGCREEVAFIPCTAWEGLARHIVNSLKKGDLVFLAGRLRTEEWTDYLGEVRTVLRMQVEMIDFCSPPTPPTTPTPPPPPPTPLDRSAPSE